MKPKKQSEKERVMELLAKETPGTAEYEKLLSVYLKLDEAEKKRPRVSPDAVVAAATNLFGILMILKHEELNVISTKAINFVLKGRL